MTLHDTQRDRLLRTIEWAREIERHLAAIRARHVGKVHFRPASTGIAMIGLLPDRPQRGKSSITTLAQLAIATTGGCSPSPHPISRRRRSSSPTSSRCQSTAAG